MSTYEDTIEASNLSAGRSALGIASFLVLTFGIAWGSWEWLLPKTGGSGSYSLALVPGAFAPAFATVIVRKWITREGFTDAGLGLHLRSWRYYLIAWLLPPVVLACIAVGAFAFGIAPDFSLQAGLAQLGAHSSFGAASWYAIPLACFFVAPLMAPILFGEEFGWRGYLQLRLFGDRPTLAAVATGIIWGLWHLPILLRGYEFHGDKSPAAIAVFCVFTVIASIVFGWLRRQSGSIWVTSVAHAATNVIGGTVTALWFPGAANAIFVMYGGILSWVPFGLLSVWIIARRR